MFTGSHWPQKNSRCRSTLKYELALWLWLEISANMTFPDGCAKRTTRSLAQTDHFLLSCEQGAWGRGRFGTVPRVGISLMHDGHEVLGVREVSEVVVHWNCLHFGPKFWSGSSWWRHDWSFERFHTSTRKIVRYFLQVALFLGSYSKKGRKRANKCTVIPLKKSVCIQRHQNKWPI